MRRYASGTRGSRAATVTSHFADDSGALKLCYCDGSWAWFTTAPLQDQWGDDWNDAPYQHNAEPPYEWMPHMAERGVESYFLVKVAWDGPFELVGAWETNSPYSVQAINRRSAPWLVPSRWPDEPHDNTPNIWAGTTITAFIELVTRAGGMVYLPANDLAVIEEEEG